MTRFTSLLSLNDITSIYKLYWVLKTYPGIKSSKTIHPKNIIFYNVTMFLWHADIAGNKTPFSTVGDALKT